MTPTNDTLVDTEESTRFEDWGREQGIIPKKQNPPSAVLANIAAIYRPKMSATERNSAIANEVVQRLTERGAFYYDASRPDFESSMYFDSEQKILYRLSSDPFKAWLSTWLQVNRVDIVFRYIEAAVATAALHGERTAGICPENYWASREDALYFSNGDGRALKITAAGLEEVDNGTDGVLFRSGKTMDPWSLVGPKDPFETCDLFRDTSCAAEHGKDLIRAFVFSLATNPRCKPPLALTGPIGSGKTKLAEGISDLMGIVFRGAKADEKRESDFWPSLDQGGIFTLDNADTKVRWLPDALAAAATNGCAEKRKLYKDSETVTLRARAWVAITSATPDFAGDAGLADRLLVARLNRREGTTSDSELSDQIKRNRDSGLSYIAHILSRALGDKDPVPKGLNARHPDFAAFAVRIGRAMGRGKEMIDALTTAETDKAQFCLENDILGASILAFLDGGGAIEGEACDLAPILEVEHWSADYKTLSPKKFARVLAKIWPHLEAIFDVSRQKVGGRPFRYRIATRGWAGPPHTWWV